MHLEVPFGEAETDRLRFEAAGPHSRAMLEGDWYFRRPIGVDADGNPTSDDGQVAQWEYALPAGKLVNGQTSFRVARRETDDNLTAGFRSPLTPAEVIAREFVRTVKSDPAVRKLLPDTSFFPERREHFMFGRLHLQRPPEFGDDRIGDGGTGRQMLMLKWLLEGAYVTATDDGGAEDFSPGSPALTDVYANWKRVGVPRAEGYEWGVFQDFAALKSKPFQVAEMRLSTTKKDQRLRLLQRSIDDAVAQQQASRLKKLGKAAIRATLARLAGDTNLNGILIGVPDSRVTDGSVRSFEHLIRELALGSEDARKAFGDFAKDRDDLTEGPDIGDFLRAKNGDREYLATILNEPGAYERFVVSTFTFLRTVVQKPTRSPYEDYTLGLRNIGAFPELLQRTENLNLVLRGSGGPSSGLLALNSDRRIARMQLPLAVEIYGPGVGRGVQVRRQGTDDAGGPGARRRNAAPAVDGDATETQVLTADVDSDNTIDGTEEGEPLFAQEGSAEEDLVDPAFATTANDGEPVAEDNDVTASAARLGATIPSPSISDRPIVFVGIRPSGREDYFLLRDWPSNGFRPRSPRHHLRLSDLLDVSVWAEPGVGEYSALVTTASDPVARLVRLRDPVGIGAYRNSAPSDAVTFTNANNPLDDPLYLRDEELVTIQVSGPGLEEDEVIEVMVDLGEFAMASLEHHDRAIAAKPRFDYEATFLDAPNGLRWASAGVIEFPDDVAKAAVDAGVPDGDNGMRRFLQAFSDPSHPETGEADLLYLHSHGGKDGTLFDHISDATPDSSRKLILDPSRHLADLGLWNTDAEWLISEACSILNEGLDNQLRPIPRMVPGLERWISVLRESPLPLHGILGFAYTKSASRQLTAEFLAELRVGQGYVESWRTVWEDQDPRLNQLRRPWAMLYYRANQRDTPREVGPDPLPGDALVYESFLTRRAFPGGVPEGNCDCEEDTPPRPLDLVAILPRLWVHAPLLAQQVPASVPSELPSLSAGLLRPTGPLTRGLVRTDGRERLQPNGTGGALTASGANDLDSARQRAEEFLREQCKVGASQMRWLDTGETARRIICGDSISMPEVTARIVRFEVMAAGLPVTGAGITVNVTPRGVERVGVRGSALPLESAGSPQVRPLALAEALSLAALKLAPDGQSQTVTSARLCWRMIPESSAEPRSQTSVVSWELSVAPADAAGAVTGTSRRVWVHAVTGELLEVGE